MKCYGSLDAKHGWSEYPRLASVQSCFGNKLSPLAGASARAA